MAKNLLFQVVGKEEIENSYEEIAKKVNKLKTTWKATAYKKDYKPLLGSILDGFENLPEKKFKKKNLQLPDEYDQDYLSKMWITQRSQGPS